MATIQSLAKVLAKVASEPEPEQALGFLTASLLSLTQSRNAVLAQMNDELGCMELTHGAGKDWEAFASQSALQAQSPSGASSRSSVATSAVPSVRVEVSISEGIVGFVAASGGPVVSGDVRSEPIYRKLFENTRSEIAVPIRDPSGRIRAVLNGESDRLDAYSEEDL